MAVQPNWVQSQLPVVPVEPVVVVAREVEVLAVRPLEPVERPVLASQRGGSGLHLSIDSSQYWPPKQPFAAQVFPEGHLQVDGVPGGT